MNNPIKNLMNNSGLLASLLVCFALTTVSLSAMGRTVRVVPRAASFRFNPHMQRAFSSAPGQPWYNSPEFRRVLKLHNPVKHAVVGTSVGMVIAGAGALYLGPDKNPIEVGLVAAGVTGGLPGFAGYVGTMGVLKAVSDNRKKN